MNNTELINQAKKLKLKGEYEEARELLLSKGYIEKLDPEVQNAFLELFPPSTELKEELNKSLKDLFSSDPKVREKASSYIQKQSRMNWTEKQRNWLRDPRTIELLIKGLEDNEEKVVLNCIVSLGMISQRYKYNDLRIYYSLVDLFENQKSEKVKIFIAQSIPQYGFAEGWNKILSVLDCKPSKSARWTVGLAVGRYGENIDKEKIDVFIQRLIEAFEKETDLEAKSALLGAIGKIGGKLVVSRLESLLEKTSDSHLKDEIKFLMEEIKGEEHTLS